MALIRWQPSSASVSEVERLRQEVGRLFNTFSPGTEPFFSRVYPALNVTEDSENLYVRAELPGVKSDSMDILVVEGRLHDQRGEEN